MAERPKNLSFRRALPSLDERIALGSLRASRFCLGIVDDPRAVPAAFDAGVNFFFFTADMHWPLYEAHRKGLEMLLARRKSIREEIVVAVVSYVTQPEFCFAPFDEAIREVKGLGRADVSVIGGSYAADFFTRLGRYKTHAGGSITGGTRALGASFHDRLAAADALSHDLVDVGFCRYNAAHRGAEREIFPKLDGKGRRSRLYGFTSTRGFLGKRRLDELGLDAEKWRPTITDHYRFALAPRAVDGLLCALRTPRQVQELADALARGPLSRDEIEYIRDLADIDAGRAVLG